MAGISKEERERRRLAALADTLPPPVEAEPMRTQVEIEHERAINAAASATLKAYREATDDAHITAADVIALHRRADAPIAGKEAVMTGTEARTRYEAITSGKLESRHWPGLFYSPADPEPLQDNMLGTKDAKWRAWFERNGGKLK